MCFVDGVGERQSDVPRFHLELREDRIAKSFSRDAGAVGHKENSAFGHGVPKKFQSSGAAEPLK